MGWSLTVSDGSNRGSRWARSTPRGGRLGPWREPRPAARSQVPRSGQPTGVVGRHPHERPLLRRQSRRAAPARRLFLVASVRTFGTVPRSPVVPPTGAPVTDSKPTTATGNASTVSRREARARSTARASRSRTSSRPLASQRTREPLGPCCRAARSSGGDGCSAPEATA